MNCRITRIALSSASLAGLLTLCLPSFGRDEPKNPDDSKAAATKSSPEAKALDLVAAAYKMADYGRETKTPEALILAAKIIGTTPFRNGDLKDAKVHEPGEFDAQKVAASLIEEALALDPNASDSLKQMAALVKSQISERSKGAIPGPVVREGSLNRNDTVDRFYIPFRGGQEAIINVRNTTRADLNLYVYDDEAGNMVARDRRDDDDCRVRFFPNSTRRYRIELRNHTPNRRAHYVLFTN